MRPTTAIHAPYVRHTCALRAPYRRHTSDACTRACAIYAPYTTRQVRGLPTSMHKPPLRHLCARRPPRRRHTSDAHPHASYATYVRHTCALHHAPCVRATDRISTPYMGPVAAIPMQYNRRAPPRRPPYCRHSDAIRLTHTPHAPAIHTPSDRHTCAIGARYMRPTTCAIRAAY